MAKRVTMRDPASGVLVEVHPDNVSARRSLGWTAATTDEIKAYDAAKRGTTAGDVAKAALAGVVAANRASQTAGMAPVKAATALGSRLLGTEDPLENVSGAKADESRIALATELAAAAGLTDVTGEAAARRYHEDVKALAEESPLATGVGEVVGAIGGGLPSGAAVGAGRSLASRLGFAAIEGGAQSSVQSIEDAYIRDKVLTGEQLAAQVGFGALLGAAGQAVGEGLSGALRRTKFADDASGAAADGAPGGPYRALAEGADDAVTRAPGAQTSDTLADYLTTMADERTLKALGARGSDLRRLGKTKQAIDAKISQIGRDVREYRLKDGTKVFGDDLTDPALFSKELQAERIAAARRELGESLDQLRKEADVVVTHNAELRHQLRADFEEWMEVAKREVVDPLRRSVTPEAQGRARYVESVLRESAKKFDDAPSLAKLREIQRDVARDAYPRPSAPGLAPLPSPNQQELVALERMLDDAYERSADRAATYLSAGKQGDYAALKAKMESFIKAAQIVDKADAQNLGNRAISPSDYAIGIGTAVADLASGGGAGAVLKGVAASAAHSAIREHGSAVAAVLADRFARRLSRRLDSAVQRAVTDAPKYLDGEAPKRLAGRGASQALAVVTGGAPLPPAGSARRGTVAAANAFRQRGDDDDRAAYLRVAKEAVAVASDPATFQRRAEESLGALPASAPNTATNAVLTALRAVQFIASKIPPDLVGVNPMTGRSDIEPVDVPKHVADEMREVWDTLNDPASVVDAVGDGTLTAEQVEAVDAVYPSLMADIRARIMAALADRSDPPPYDKRLQLDLLLGLNGAGEWTASPKLHVQLAALAEAAALSDQTEAMKRRGGGQTNPQQIAGQHQTLSGQLETGA